MAVRRGAFKIHLWTFSTPPAELQRGINYCPGAEVPNVTTPTPTDHSDKPVLFNVEVDPGERYPIHPSSSIYKYIVPMLLDVVKEHEEELVPGDPQLNWCDRAVMVSLSPCYRLLTQNSTFSIFFYLLFPHNSFQHFFFPFSFLFIMD
ncbi:N-acetylgalactosamine-6-sulfatase [Portunus trituberculatus]|uniref:N-acetylgalactosamine-6-sulfatase n=1 Tax=Portunus trituberculatus TaxID=210409 RepID=A0A5B7HIK0_PORTR|nr:N-acetylgalactosamine-6-sulfatase [Portunus trituberculatus]